MKISYIYFFVITLTIIGSSVNSIYTIIDPTNAMDFQNKIMYSVKFACDTLVGPDKERGFISQNYSTLVNVHNPSSHSISFLKKAVIAQSEDEKRGQIFKFINDTLKPDQSLSINCRDIIGLLNYTSFQVGDGFVVILSDEKLDVSSVYTTQDSIDVEYIQPTNISSALVR